MVAVGVAINRVEALKGNAGKVFGGWYAVEDDRLVAGHRSEKVDNGLVASVGEESVVPFIDQMEVGEILDLREVHDHAVGGIACLVDDAA